MKQLTARLKGKAWVGFICVVLVLAGALLLPPLMRTAQAANSGDYEYTVNADGVTAAITGYTGPGGEIAIPETVTDGTNVYTVTAMGSDLFTAATVTSVTIPKTVLTIDCGAFWECRSLQSIEVDADNPNYQSVDGLVFSKDGATLFHCPAAKAGDSYAVPDTVTAIGDSAFDHNQNLKSIVLTENVTQIGNSAFWRCEVLEGFTIPASVTTVGDSAFANCGTITALLVETGNTAYRSIDGVLFDITGAALIQCPAGKAGSYIVPSGVTTLCAGSFRGCYHLTSVETGSNVTDIGSCAFAYCDGLQHIELGGSVATIGYAAFQGCTSLENVTFPGSISDIGNSAFDSCSGLKAAYFLGNAPVAGSDIFSGCADGFTVYYKSASTGFSDPWNGYTAAVFNPDITYTITFDLNGAAGTAPDTQTVYEGVKAVCPNEPTFEGQIFGGWYTEAGCDNAWDFKNVVTSNLALFAQWKDFYGSGTEADPYQVSTPAQLNAVRNYPDACFIMTNDIDMTQATSEGGAYWNDGAGWVPIGTSSKPFAGVFDGGGYAVKMLHQRITSDGAYGGLFGYIDGGVLQNLGMERNQIIMLDGKAGSIAGNIIGSSVSNCYNTGSVSGEGVGGIVGYADSNSTISKCYNTGCITSYNGASLSGGIIASMSNGTISSCYNIGDVTGDQAGGITASIGGQSVLSAVYDCYNMGNIKGIYDTGGIVGNKWSDDSTISNCYNTGSVSVSGYDAGGIVGETTSTISNCYFLDRTSSGTGYGPDTSISVTREEMLQQTTFSGFNFGSVWTMQGDEDYPYPELQGMTTVVWPASPDFAGGNGTAYDPYRVTTPDQLDNVRNYPGKCFELVNDIDMQSATSEGGTYYYEGKGWEPIGNFTGCFYGSGHSVIALQLTRINYNDYATGLFGIIKNGGKVSNLGIINCDIYGGDHVGAICGVNEGVIEGCYNTGSIRGYGTTTSLGGIAGGMHNNGRIARCYNIGKIEAIPTMASGCGYVGGIVGEAYYNGGGEVRDCYNAGDVIGKGSAISGGIIGWCGSIYNCYNVGSIFSLESTGEICADTAVSEHNAGLYFLKRNEYITGALDSNQEDLATGKTIGEMQLQSSFTGFDFDHVWTMSGETSYPYPQLQGVEQVAIPENARDFSGGNGMPNNPYKVTISTQLDNVRKYPSASFILLNDIDLTNDVKEGGLFFNEGLGFEPIGNGGDPFRGCFEGNGKAITGLMINRSDDDYSGLFGVCYNANIKDIRVINVNITARDSGGICGYSRYSSIRGCSVSGNIRSNYAFDDIGGIVGYGYCGSVTDCFNSAIISGTEGDDNLGGITGQNGYKQSMLRCFNTANINGYYYGTSAGGLTGQNDGVVTDCYNTGRIMNLKNDTAGGIVSKNTGVIERCYNAGISQQGIAYKNGGSISDCYYLGKQCALNGTVSNVVGKTFDELKVPETFAGFDFESVWTIGGEPTYPYPELKNMYHIPERADAVAFEGGTGTAVNPYLVSTPAQLNEIRYHSNACFILVNNIDLEDSTSEGGLYFNNGSGWEPIDFFFGVLDGNGYTITGLNINRPEQDNVALIGTLYDGEIKRLCIESSTITGKTNASSIAGTSYGEIYNCKNGSNITAEFLSGGITGSNFGLLQECGNYGTINALMHGTAGGIAGDNEGTIDNCINSGTVEASYDIYSDAGGITGSNNANINNSKNEGTVLSQGHSGGITSENNSSARIYLCTNTGVVTSTNTCGGIAALNDEGEINHCTNDGIITGKGCIGGIVGAGSNGTITLCINHEDINASKGDDCGGIAGSYYQGTISYCYNTGKITGNGTNCGGITGESGTHIKDCFNLGDIAGGGSYGGIAGMMYTNYKVEHCYNAGYVQNNSGIVGYIQSGSVTESYYLSWDGNLSEYSKSLDQLKQKATYTGFDFDNVWEIREGQSLPILKGLPFIYPNSFVLDRNAVTIGLSRHVQLHTTLLPEGATNRNIVWLSSNTNVATVDYQGRVYARSLGTAQITATAQGGGFSDTCSVTVEEVHVTSLIIDAEVRTAEVGSIFPLRATLLPSDATYPAVTWSSDNEMVATVSQNGLVTVAGVGNATITATADGISDTCEIRVMKTAVSVVTLSSHSESIATGDTRTLIATVSPSDATYPTVTWTSSDTDVATVDQSGNVTGVGGGKTTITATADGVSDTCEITVIPAEYRITAAANNAAYGTVTGGGVYGNGASVTLYATPKAGYRFVRWTNGTTQLSTSAKYTLTANADQSITAEFTAIGVPTLTAASSGYNSTKLTWTAVTGAAGYEVWHSSTANGTYTKLGTATGTTYANTNLVLNTPYYYKINAYCTATTATTYGNRSAYAVATPVPAAPTASASVTSYNSVKVSWSAVPGASGYELCRATSQNGSYSVVKSTTSTSYANTSLNTGTTYYYKVRAYAGKNVYGTYSAIVSVKPMLTAVTGVSASAYNPTSVKISWNSVAGRTKYEVWRSTSPTGGFVRIKSTSSTSYKDTSCTPFVMYYYQIRVYRTVSSKPVYSASASATVSAKPILGNVTGVKAAVSSPSSVKLSWSSVSGCSGYEIRRSTVAGSSYTVVKTVTGKSYTDSNLTPNITYYYQVVAYRKAGSGKVYSTPCAPVSAKPVFGSVTNPKAVRSSAGKIKLTWSAVSRRKGYVIYRSTNPDSGFVKIKLTTSTSFTDSGLTVGVTYYYKIQAYLKVGSSDYYSGSSAVVSAVP